MRGEGQGREIGMGWAFGCTDNSVWSYQLQAAIDELSVQHGLNVIHSLGSFGHVETHRQWVKTIIHSPRK